jgi:hypothetical protein
LRRRQKSPLWRIPRPRRRTSSLHWAASRDSPPGTNFEHKKRGPDSCPALVPWHHGSRALAASGLHRDALCTVTTHGHHLLYPQRSWSRGPGARREMKRTPPPPWGQGNEPGCRSWRSYLMARRAESPVPVRRAADRGRRAGSLRGSLPPKRRSGQQSLRACPLPVRRNVAAHQA